MIRQVTSIALVACVGGLVPSRAETKRYALEIPAGRSVRYELPLEPRHVGPLTVLAEWSGSRLLSVRIEPPPGGGMTIRRNGPSPQRIELEVDRGALRVNAPWMLTVRSPSGREAGEGVLTIELPEPAPPPDKPQPRIVAAPPDPWAAWPMPANAPASWTHFDDWAHDLRALLQAERRPDVCRWQEPLLDYITRTRRALIERGEVPLPSTRSALRVIASAVDDVEELRASDDPFIAGPFPEDALRREAFLRVRSRNLAPLEEKLDRVLRRIGNDHAPDLAVEDWPVRFVSCLTACERHFAEAPVVGADRAPNAELAGYEWDRIVEAARVLFALADVEPNP